MVRYVEIGIFKGKLYSRITEKRGMNVNVKLIPLAENDREQFILDNQDAFNYGALEEFGRRDDQFPDGMFRFEKVIRE